MAKTENQSRVRKNWDYFRYIAAHQGRAVTEKDSGTELPESIAQSKYSLLGYFDYENDNKSRSVWNKVADDKVDLSPYPLLRWYLGDENAFREMDEAFDMPDNLIEESHLRINKDRTLYQSQIEAIKNAFRYPISFVEGPPGTGKTEMILNLASCAVRRGHTICVVSNNNAALENICKKLDTYEALGVENAKELAEAYLPMGNSSVREATRERRFSESESIQGVGRGGSPFYANIIRTDENKNGMLFFTSTIHSMGKALLQSVGKDKFGPVQYDFVVIDECSQVNPLLGLVAMKMAKHLVLAGDVHQLPPVYDCGPDVFRDIEGASHFDISEEYKWVPDVHVERSFLESCRRIAEIRGQEIPEVFLNEHFRCSPGIINFCNQEVYLKKSGWAMNIRTPGGKGEEDCPPIRILWFEGNYADERKKRYDNSERTRTTHLNRKQIAVFMKEEWPILHERIENGEKVAILAPYIGQIEELERALSHDAAYRELAATENGDDQDGERNPYRIAGKPDEQEEETNPLQKKLPVLTISRSQGREFDVVYLLPVDDGTWEWPWSQQYRLINVALSRAMKEVCVITSSHLMSADMQRRLTGTYVPPEESRSKSAQNSKEEDQLYLQKLLDYVADFKGVDLDHENPDNRFGFHKAETVSVFDKAITQPLTKKKTDGIFLSGEELALAQDLLRAYKEEFLQGEMILYGQVPLLDIGIEGCSEDVREYVNRGASVDFLICSRKGRPLLALEVDGAIHSNQDSRIRDRKKSQAIQSAGGLVVRMKPLYDGDDPENMDDSICVEDDAMRQDQLSDKNFVVLRMDVGMTSQELEVIDRYLEQSRKAHDASATGRVVAASLRECLKELKIDLSAAEAQQRLLGAQLLARREFKGDGLKSTAFWVPTGASDQMPNAGANNGIMIEYRIDRENEQMFFFPVYTERGKKLIEATLRS